MFEIRNLMVQDSSQSNFNGDGLTRFWQVYFMRMNFLDQYVDVSHGGTTGHGGNSGFNSSKFQLDIETIFGLKILPLNRL